jgi:hypothetical protein
MSHVTFAAHSRYRVYDLDLPLRIPGFGVGFAISKFKQIGVWSKLPPALRAKAKDARGTWSVLKLTQKDLDSVSERCLGNHRHGIERALEVRGQAS